MLYRTPFGGRRRPCWPNCSGYRARYDGGWEDELNIRTHYPTRRGVLEAPRDDLPPATTVETSAW
jgi:hypothetical protein